MRTTKPADYVYKRYRIAHPSSMPITTVSLPWIEHMRMTRQAGGVKELSALVRSEAAFIRAAEHAGSLSAAVLTSVRSKLKEI
jgi:hypothetical protein